MLAFNQSPAANTASKLMPPKVAFVEDTERTEPPVSLCLLWAITFTIYSDIVDFFTVPCGLFTDTNNQSEDLKSLVLLTYSLTQPTGSNLLSYLKASNTKGLGS